jgi:hypothetical protein
MTEPANHAGDVNFMPSFTTTSIPFAVAQLNFTATLSGPASQTHSRHFNHLSICC